MAARQSDDTLQLSLVSSLACSTVRAGGGAGACSDSQDARIEQ
jgi:hypothetical protein